MEPPLVSNTTPTDIGPPRTASLKQQAYLELKRLILSDEMAAGTVLSVRQLAARLDMSRTPVHAAIERLEADGLVTLAPQQGVVVREVSLQDIVNHFGIRQALEPFLMSRLAGKLTDDQVQALRANQARHLAALKQHRLDEYVEVDVEFHQLLCRFHGNEEITNVMQRLRDKIQRVIYRIVRNSPERVTESYSEHQAILDALVESDGERAANLVNEHLEKGLRRILPER